MWQRVSMPHQASQHSQQTTTSRQSELSDRGTLRTKEDKKEGREKGGFLVTGGLGLGLGELRG